MPAGPMQRGFNGFAPALYARKSIPSISMGRPKTAKNHVRCPPPHLRGLNVRGMLPIVGHQMVTIGTEIRTYPNNPDIWPVQKCVFLIRNVLIFRLIQDISTYSSIRTFWSRRRNSPG